MLIMHDDLFAKSALLNQVEKVFRTPGCAVCSFSLRS